MIKTKQNQKQKYDINKNREKFSSIENLWVVTNLSIFCLNFGIMLLVCMDF